MLNQRQLEMVREFEKNSPSYLSANDLVKKFDVSMRTVQSDIKNIREFFKGDKWGEFISTASKGSKLVIFDQSQFDDRIKEACGDTIVSKLIDQTDRVRKLIVTLLNQKKYVSRQFLMNKIFVSVSTLTLDLNEANQYVQSYNLQIERKPKLGIRITGDESDRRRCLVKLGNLELITDEHRIQAQESDRQEIEKILVGVLLKQQHHISDTVFQNLIVHIDMAIKRMGRGFYLQHDRKELGEEFSSEYGAAKEIFEKLSHRLHFLIREDEINNLAIYLKGKSDYEENGYISKEVNNFILLALREINDKFDIDFTQEIDLRIALALHLMPLMTRLEYDMQNENRLLDQIKQSFPLAFDIAVYMSLLLREFYGKQIEEGEIAYLAIYFNQYLAKYNNITGKQRVLIITSLKRSESILLRQRFVTWFANEISVLTLANVTELAEIEIEDYDVLFTTDQNKLTENLGAILISFFPSESEYSKIKLAIDGFKGKMEIVNLFKKELFYFGHLATKKDVLTKLSKLSKEQVKGAEMELLTAIQLREDHGSSYFGNHIALPHPINPFTVETFVSVALLDQMIDWDRDQNKVQLVMLVVIEKNNAKVFQLWNYLAKIIQEKGFAESLLKNPSFDYFQLRLSQVLDDYI